jgi:Domain of unknown function (DUF4440)
MYKLAVLALVGLALNFGWQEQDEPPPNPEMQRQEIINLEHEAARAIQTNTGTFFRRVYSDDFSGTMSHGQPVDKTSFINAVQTYEVKYEGFNASDINVRLYKDTAVATCLWTARGTFKEQKFNSQMRVLHVYINTPRGWRVVAGQITLLPPGGQLPL